MLALLDATLEVAFAKETGFDAVPFFRPPLHPKHVQGPFWPLASHKACGANSLVERKI